MRTLFIMGLVCAFAFTAASVAFSQSPIGIWKTIDDETGQPRAYVQIYERGGKLFGKIVRLINVSVSNPRCTACEDYRRNQPILGMDIVTNMRNRGDYWGDGEILDPEKGKIYSCTMWVENNTLKVRGWWGPFHRTQTWQFVSRD
jgi:uncharacterized protein (DUF2147 family)